jgi:hypothetical protein
MAHPSETLPKSIYVIDATATDLQATPKSGKFFSITCSVAGSVSVTGGGVFIYVDATALANDAAAQKFIDPSEGVAFSTKAEVVAAGDGFYESIPTEARAIPMIAGQTIYGRFDSLMSDGTFTGFAYAG